MLNTARLRRWLAACDRLRAVYERLDAAYKWWFPPVVSSVGYGLEIRVSSDRRYSVHDVKNSTCLDLRWPASRQPLWWPAFVNLDDCHGSYRRAYRAARREVARRQSLYRRPAVEAFED